MASSEEVRQGHWWAGWGGSKNHPLRGRGHVSPQSDNSLGQVEEISGSVAPCGVSGECSLWIRRNSGDIQLVNYFISLALSSDPQNVLDGTQNSTSRK